MNVEKEITSRPKNPGINEKCVKMPSVCKTLFGFFLLNFFYPLITFKIPQNCNLYQLITAMRASYLEKENAILRTQVSTLREERNSLQSLLLRRQLHQKQRAMINLVVEQQHKNYLEIMKQQKVGVGEEENEQEDVQVVDLRLSTSTSQTSPKNEQSEKVIQDELPDNSNSPSPSTTEHVVVEG